MRTWTSRYKRVKGRSHTVEKRKAIHPQKPHATSQPSRFSQRKWTRYVHKQSAVPDCQCAHRLREVYISYVHTYLQPEAPCHFNIQ